MGSGEQGPSASRFVSAVSAMVQAHVPSSWRRPRRLLLVGAVLLAVIALVLAARPTISRHPAPGTTVFPIGDRVVLRFVHSTGSVLVRTGADRQVSITEHRNGITGAIHASYRQHGDVITVRVSHGPGLPAATWVDFAVAVPRDVNATVAVPAGTLRAANLSDTLVLNDVGGSIWADNVSGAIALRTVSGSINTTRVVGQVWAVTGTGTITTAATRLRGHSMVRARNGTINFHGSLDPGCQAVFKNTNGTVSVTVPRGSSFLLDARTAHGSINSGFGSVHVSSESDALVAHGRVGQGAPARVSIQTSGGPIALNRAP